MKEDIKYKDKKKQVIHCDVKSCKHHNEEDCKCDLDEIKVGSSCDCDDDKDRDEVVCSSLKKEK